MSQDSSLVGAFDLKSQAGVMSVLAAIRASKLSPAEKNELRDLVFSYSNGGGDASVRNLLEQKLTANQIAPVGIQRAGKPAPVLSFGTYRPTPDFKTTLETTPVEPPVPAPVFYKNVVAETAVNAGSVPAMPLPTPTPTPTPTPAQPAVTEQTIPTPHIATPVAEPPQAPVVPPVVNNQVPVVPPVPVSVPIPSPVLAMPTPAQTADGNLESTYLERIRQIKTAVNSKVGNPVNLVDINNEVGREYMNALLEAMKKLGSGAVSEMEPAMARLESAFSAVEVAIAKHGEVNPTMMKPAPVAPVHSTVPPAPVMPTPVTPHPPVPIPPPPTPPPTPTPVTPTPVVHNVPPPVFPQPPQSPIPQVPYPPMAPLPSQPLDAKTEDRSTAWAATDNTNKSAVKTDSDIRTPSLVDSAKILTPKDLADPATLETGDKGDPLATREIDDGLNQLLSDWSLFKKSGLFGTGPKGIEHPLFKKIADLQVPLLLAGRFDGASQEIRQSVTDYMNGWRYEQGIVYLPGETFEKYLRRVIKHILDLQKKRQTP